jgi:hypothetical protein
MHNRTGADSLNIQAASQSAQLCIFRQRDFICDLYPVIPPVHMQAAESHLGSVICNLRSHVCISRQQNVICDL